MIAPFELLVAQTASLFPLVSFACLAAFTLQPLCQFSAHFPDYMRTQFALVSINFYRKGRSGPMKTKYAS